MPQRLEVPEVFSGRSVHRHQRIGKQRWLFTVVAGLVEGRRAERQIGDATLRIQNHTGPDIDAGALVRAALVPCVMEFVARLGHPIEVPDFLAGAHIEGPHPARCALLRRFLGARSRDDQILVNGRRGGDAQKGVRKALHHLGRFQVDDAVLAKAFYGIAIVGIERDQQATGCTEHDLRPWPGPIGRTARGGIVAAGHLIGPYLFAGFRIQRHQAPIRRGDIHHALHHQRRVLRCRIAARHAIRRAHVIGPDRRKLADIGGGYLAERRIAAFAIVMAISRPFLREVCGAGT